MKAFPESIFSATYQIKVFKNKTHIAKIKTSKTHRNTLTITGDIGSFIGWLDLDLRRIVVVVDGLSLFAGSKREENRTHRRIVIGGIIQVGEIRKGENGASSAADLARGVVVRV